MIDLDKDRLVQVLLSYQMTDR